MKIGILSFQFHNWIAGNLYNKTIIRALSQLPESIRPEIHLIMRKNDDHRHIYEEFEAIISSTIYYDHFSNKAAKVSLTKKIARLLKGTTPSVSLQNAVRYSNIDLVFPLLGSLDTDFPASWVGWIPDFQHRHLPELFSEQDRKSRDQKFQKLVQTACHTVVSSEDAKRDLLEFYSCDETRVSTYRFRTYAEPGWFVDSPEEVADRFGLPEKFLMFPSQFWKHKNHEKLLEALARFKAAGHPDVCLVLTGQDADYRNPAHPENLKKRIVDLGLESNIRHLGVLPRHEQIQLMRCACAIVQPSLFEGWSMLVEDCRALGKTVLLSDLPVHREQAYPSAHYFNPHDPENLTGLLKSLWPSLSPGPDLNAEATARSENQRLIAENGRFLLDLFQSVCQKA